MELWKESQLRQLTFAIGIDTAYPILENFSKNIGFNFCAVTVASTHHQPHFKTLEINNYSNIWKRAHEQDNDHEADPVIAHCKNSMLPFVWSKTAYAHAPNLWRALQQEGLRYGWSQSFHNEEKAVRSTLSLARKNCEVSPLELYEHVGYMHFVTSRLTELFISTLPATAPKSKLAHLSRRELEVLQFSASGKTAYEISRILSLSERTVNYHVQNIMLKLNVCNKISAVIAAARAGII
ncbi:autoinducer binding domain-containing protein [Pseudomonas sp. TH43]|uniref:autoinducer binding domain-containing protein n=1 Tax=Pseudomonas sp. TH43 TaxID=2796407 RepID=UPI001911E0B8|nr:autoinducer binding domain-containing protein [Pseudomonas sp. TH43]MBK5376838.1 autoinducer binding domain-containing protein [Pseudomonas sp. TH43]